MLSLLSGSMCPGAKARPTLAARFFRHDECGNGRESLPNSRSVFHHPPAGGSSGVGHNMPRTTLVSNGLGVSRARSLAKYTRARMAIQQQDTTERGAQRVRCMRGVRPVRSKPDGDDQSPSSEEPDDGKPCPERSEGSHVWFGSGGGVGDHPADHNLSGKPCALQSCLCHPAQSTQGVGSVSSTLLGRDRCHTV